MAVDIHVKIIKRNHSTDEWEEIRLYSKINNEFKVIEPYSFRNGELFDILNGREDDLYKAYTLSSTHFPEYLKKEIEEWKNTLGCYDFKEITLADLKLYLFKSPMIRDLEYEEDDPKAWKTNPIKYFIERIEYYIGFYDPDWKFFTSPSDIKILYWFDC